MPFRPSGIVTLLSDFGLSDVYASSMKGVILSLAPKARIVDLSHQIPAQQVRIGALALASAAPFFPPGTIHIAVVDPGVGTARKPLALFAKGQAFLGPDNGLLTLAAGGRAPGRHLANPRLFLPKVSATFHGRDVFAPVAAHLLGGVRPDALGPPARASVHLSLPEPRASKGALRGEVIAVDAFGNAITNLDAETLARRSRELARARVEAGGARISGISRTYGEHPPGSLVALIGSAGYLEIAEVNGSAARRLSLEEGDPVTVRA